MHTIALFLICLTCAGCRPRKLMKGGGTLQSRSHAEQQHSRQQHNTASIPHSVDVSKVQLHRRHGVVDPLKATSILLLALNPAAAWQFSGSEHTCSSAMRANRGWRIGLTAAMVKRQDESALDGLNRRSLLTGLVAIGASVCNPSIAWAAEKTDFVKVIVNGEEKTFPAIMLASNFADGFKLQIKDITGEIFDKLFWQDMKEEPASPLRAKDMKRMDESDDGVFYSQPRFVYHIDEGAVAALTNYYQKSITKPKLDILDICSSWVSHYPKDFKETMNSIVGTGMNTLELQANSQLTSFVARDLNKEPKLPFPDSSFDIVTCVVSVDYLISPLTVFKEVNRVLKPGGRFIVSQSNRLFATKAVDVWLGFEMEDRLRLIGKYFQYAGDFSAPKAFDISAQGKNVKGAKAEDPMYIVEAAKA